MNKKGFVDNLVDQRSKSKATLISAGISEDIAARLADFFVELHYYASILEELGTPPDVVDKLVVSMYKDYLTDNPDINGEMTKLMRDSDRMAIYAHNLMERFKEDILDKITPAASTESKAGGAELSTEIKETKRTLH